MAVVKWLFRLLEHLRCPCSCKEVVIVERLKLVNVCWNIKKGHFREVSFSGVSTVMRLSYDHFLFVRLPSPEESL